MHLLLTLLNVERYRVGSGTLASQRNPGGDGVSALQVFWTNPIFPCRLTSRVSRDGFDHRTAVWSHNRE